MRRPTVFQVSTRQRMNEFRDRTTGKGEIQLLVPINLDFKLEPDCAIAISLETYNSERCYEVSSTVVLLSYVTDSWISQLINSVLQCESDTTSGSRVAQSASELVLQ